MPNAVFRKIYGYTVGAFPVSDGRGSAPWYWLGVFDDQTIGSRFPDCEAIFAHVKQRLEANESPHSRLPNTEKP